MPQTTSRRNPTGRAYWLLFYPQIINFFLNPVQKSESVRPVHLRVVELERNGKCRLQQAAFVFAPNKKRIIKNAAVHTDSTVYFIFCANADVPIHTNLLRPLCWRQWCLLQGYRTASVYRLRAADKILSRSLRLCRCTSTSTY